MPILFSLFYKSNELTATIENGRVQNAWKMANIKNQDYSTLVGFLNDTYRLRESTLFHKYTKYASQRLAPYRLWILLRV